VKLYIHLLIVAASILIVLASVAKAAVISELDITVLDWNNQPVENAIVEIWNTTLVARSTTNSSGIAKFYNISDGNYTVYVYINGIVYKFTICVDNTTSIELVLPDPSQNISNNTSMHLNNNTSDNMTSDTIKGWFDNNKILVGVGLVFILLILIAYALSGRKIPRRR